MSQYRSHRDHRASAQAAAPCSNAFGRFLALSRGATLVGLVLLLPLSASAETLVIRVHGLTPGAGTVQVMLWNEPAGFPTHAEKALAHKGAPVTNARMELSLAGLPKGTYAVAAYQDLNGNGKLDRSLLGWPTEPVGASNAATGLMGPPKYKAAAFELNQVQQIVDVVVK